MSAKPYEPGDESEGRPVMGVCDVPVISNVCDVAGEAAATLVSAPFEWLARAMGDAASWLFTAVWSVFDTTTLVDVTRPEYVKVYNLIFGIGAILMLLFFLLQLITGLVKRDPAALTRAALGLARSVLGSFLVITLVGLALQITDQLSTGIIQAAGETTQSMGDKIAALVAGLGGITMASPGVGAILIIFLAGLAIASAAIVWLSLLIRKALLLVAIVLAPLAFSGSSWDAAKGWISKWAMLVLALILSKLVLVVILLVAVTQVSAPISADLASVSDPLAGIVLMALAGFSPYMVYRFLSFVGVDFYNQMGAEQDAKRALNRPLPIPTTGSGEGPKPRQQQQRWRHESRGGQPVLLDRSGGRRSTSGIRRRRCLWRCCIVRRRSVRRSWRIGRSWHIGRRCRRRCCRCGPGGGRGDRREGGRHRRTEGRHQARRAGGADGRRRQPHRHHTTSRTSAAERAHAHAILVRVVGCVAWQRAATPASTRPTDPAEQGVSP